MTPGMLRAVALLLLTLLPPHGSGAVKVDLALTAAGGTLPNTVYRDAIFAYTMVRPNVSISYTALGSVPSQCRIMAHPNPAKCLAGDTTQPLAVDFAAADVPLDAMDYVLNPDLQMYPTVATAIVPVYNLNAAANLTLSTAVLAQIFSGQILMWDDPRIVVLNPNFSTWRVPAGQRIEVVVRNSGSGTTGAFRQALCLFDDVFARQVGPGTDANWSGVNVTLSARPQAYVTVTPYTISYTPYDVAMQYALLKVLIKKSTGAVVEASTDSILYAVLELGLAFGNNGDDPKRLTAELANAKGDKAWPIVTYTYLIMRKSTPRAGASCAAVQETALFWSWFWTADLAHSVVQNSDFLPLPDVIKDVVVSRFITDITCNGQPMLSAAQSTVIPGAGLAWMTLTVKKIALVYALEDPTISIPYTSLPLLTEAAVEAALDPYMFVLATVPWTAAVAHSGVKIVLAGVAIAVISQNNLTLDFPTLAAILEGNVTTWLHPAILRLNAAGVWDSDSNPITDPTQRIVLLQGPISQDSFLINTIRKYVPSFTGVAMAAARYFSSDDLLRAALSATPFSLGISTVQGTFDSNLQFCSLVRADGAVVAPSWQSVQSCATADVYNALTGDYRLQDSDNSGCYPLATAVYITARKSKCNLTTDPQRTTTASLLEWLLLYSNVAQALREQGVAPLSTLPVVNATNRQALATLSCVSIASEPGGPSLMYWVYIIVGVCCLVLGIAFGVVGVWVWRSTAEMRALRKQFADDNVAQECAAAIASFDLEAVEWLKTVADPNRIQKSFLQIIHLLTEVRPFIPDQLLATLRWGEGMVVFHLEVETAPAPRETAPPDVLPRPLSVCPSEAPDEGDPDRLEEVRQMGGGSFSDVSSIRSHSSKSSRSSVGARRVLPLKSPMAWAFRSALSPPSGDRRLSVATREWRKKLAVFMYVRFGFAPSVVGEQAMPDRVTSLMVDLVTIGKAHGATIDHVGYGCMALHWGVTANTAQGPLRATTAALEMAQVRRRLPGALREALRLKVAVTFGDCDVSTATAAGHRFFVVAGREIQMAMDAVAQDLMGKCKCEILISQDVNDDVQYALECMPRVWFNNVLLWEPRKQRQASGAMDEWMYELQNLEAEEDQHFSAKMFQSLFLLARNETSRSQLHSEARRLRRLYGADMSPQDLAALQHLEATTGVAEMWGLSSFAASM
eukprot:EG_transcript_302